MTEDRAYYEHGPDGRPSRAWRDVADAMQAAEELRPSTLESFAGEMKDYYDALRRRGFSECQATHLATYFQTICLVLTSADVEGQG